MKRIRTWLPILGTLLAICGISNSVPAQQPASDKVPVSVVATIEAKHGKDVPVINDKEDVRVMEGRNRLRVTDWVPLQGTNGDLELLILIDEAVRQTVTTQFDDVRIFMNAQPPPTEIAIGYMEYGTVRMVQKFTTDHEAAGKALRIPLGAAAGGSSPFLAVTDAIKHWPESKVHRRAIFLVSDGIDPLQPGFIDSYLDEAVATAQRAGVQISTIYTTRAGHFGHTLWRIDQGQNNLSQLADKTGGEASFQGLDTPVSFGPFLEMFAARLNHQYLLTFLIQPEKKPSYRHVRLETEVPNADLVTADRVYVPAAK